MMKRTDVISSFRMEREKHDEELQKFKESQVATTDDPLFQKAKEELAKLKEGKTGELSFEDLNNAGVSKGDMRKVITKENIGNIHAGHMGQVIGKKASQSRRSSVGPVGRGVIDTAPLSFPASAHASQAVKAITNIYYTFDFPSNRQTGNPEIARIKTPGAVVMCGSYTSTVGIDGNFSDPSIVRYSKQSEAYAVSFPKDCTVPDDVATEMLYQKYQREANTQTATRPMDYSATR